MHLFKTLHATLNYKDIPVSEGGLYGQVPLYMRCFEVLTHITERLRCGLFSARQYA